MSGKQWKPWSDEWTSNLVDRIWSGLSVRTFMKIQYFALLNKWTRFESKHSISHYSACAPSENLVQSAHPCSMIRAFARLLWVAKDPNRFKAESGDSDYPHRLVWVFAWRTCTSVFFVESIRMSDCVKANYGDMLPAKWNHIIWTRW